MAILASLVKMNLPGSVGFLWIALAIGVLLLFGSENARKWGRSWLTGVALLYLVLASPLTVRILEKGLDEGYSWIASREEAGDAEAVVVLGGGSIAYQARGETLTALSEQSSLRVLEAARLYKLLDPKVVIVSGGLSGQAGRVTPESMALRDGLISLGVPGDVIVLESESDNTMEHPVMVDRILKDQGIERFILVTSPAHMYRAVEVFRAAGLEPLPSVGVWHSEELNPPTEGWVPNARSLYASQVAVREHLARAYYWMQGWL